MNYRRGFQRVYAVLTLAWIAVVAAGSLHDHFAQRSDPYAKYGGSFVPPPLSSREAIPSFEEFKKTLPSVPPPPRAPGAAIDYGAHSVAPLESPGSESPLRYWAVRSGVALLPPGVIYLFLFYVIPWIYRGFRPAKQI
jgi:hypothetical protein